jgi:hypothetical protein
MHHGKRENHGARIFARLDGNGDGNVTRDESQQAWTKWFGKIDTNKDSVVTMDEVKAYRKAKRAGK